MAKPTKDPLDEAEIIRLRDDSATTNLDGQLDSQTRRALADSRLRALALALGTQRDSDAPGDDPDDRELLEYLLDMLPEDRRRALERTLHGNARAFGRLMTLRLAFNTQTDKRDRRRADHPAREISRRSTSRVEVRSVGDRLVFRDASRKAAYAQQREQVTLDLAQPRLPRPQVRSGPKTGWVLTGVLERTASLLTSGRNRVDEAQKLLARWGQLDLHRLQEPSTGIVRDDEIKQVGEDLSDVLLQLQRLADQLSDDIRRTLSMTIDMSQPSQVHHLAHKFAPDFAHENWSETIDVPAGPWPLRLAGTVLATPTLTVTLQGVDAQGLRDVPLLTLVRPNHGYEMANFDSQGVFALSLPTGGSVLLVQGEKEVWEVPLTFA